MSHAKKTCLLFVFSLSSLLVWSQETKEEKKAAKEAQIKGLAERKNFKFFAETMNPSKGRVRQIAGQNYYLTVSPDSVISDLPYFGRAYSAPIGNSDVGMKFIVTEYDYEISERKKGGYTIIISPKSGDARKITLTMGSEGNTTLNIISNNRETITYNGYIDERIAKR